MTRTRGTDAGVTLVELLVVMAIVAVLSLGASLTVGRGSSAADRDAALLVGQIDGLRDRALRDGIARGLSIDGRHLQARRFTGGQWQDQGPPLRLTGQAALMAGQPGRAQVVLLPDGRVSPFEVRLGSGPDAILCRAVPDGTTACVPR